MSVLTGPYPWAQSSWTARVRESSQLSEGKGLEAGRKVARVIILVFEMFVWVTHSFPFRYAKKNFTTGKAGPFHIKSEMITSVSKWERTKEEAKQGHTNGHRDWQKNTQYAKSHAGLWEELWIGLLVCSMSTWDVSQIADVFTAIKASCISQGHGMLTDRQQMRL